MINYKFHCSIYSKQYVRSNVTDFGNRFTNYKSAFQKVSKSGKTPKITKEHFHLPEHIDMGDWRVALIDRTESRKEHGLLYNTVRYVTH